jgi:probable phosphoglycerate mutase
MADEPESYRQHRFRRPPGATELLLVRHGESEPAIPGKPFPLVDGHGDPALAPQGLEQAGLVGDRLADQAIDAIYVSTLRRTAQTAAPLAARLGLDRVVLPDLREVHLGEWEGGAFRERVAANDALVVKMVEEERWDAIPGAESADHFARRVRDAVHTIVAAHPEQRVAVFTHGGVIGEILAQAARSRPFAFVGVDNGSISHIVIHGERWLVRRVNDTAHLPGGFDLALETDPPAGTGFSA